MGDLFDDYGRSSCWDEMFAGGGAVRDDYAELRGALAALSPSDLLQRCAARDRSFRDQGITFSFPGEERPFPLDLVPRVIPAGEWAAFLRAIVTLQGHVCTQKAVPTGRTAAASSSTGARPGRPGRRGRRWRR